jgi:hypothetical protein
MGLLDDAIREHLDLKRARGGDPAEIERLEREALGPVRREPPLSQAYSAGPRETRGEFFDPAVRHEDHLTDLEELQEHGYHDSTAPHLHEHHHDAVAGTGEFPDTQSGWMPERSDDRVTRLPGDGQTRRRFLKRGRHGAERLPGRDHGLEAEAVHYSDQAEGAGRLFDQHGGLEDLGEGGSPSQESTPPAGGMPPQLQFEHPPKRPTFAADPSAEMGSDTLGDGWGEPIEPAPAGSGAPDDLADVPPADRSATALPPPVDDTQETTEFEVEAQHADSDSAQDDVLEETPDFLHDTPEHDRLWFEQRPPKDFDFNG